LKQIAGRRKTYSNFTKLRCLFGLKLRCLIDAKLNSKEWFAEYVLY